ncbi:ABC transporter substrate-binding protein [Actinopolymorpha alba]|uniref:ABC transporter substrate-binding protein n=1 Tax=Actinopolymorpha alba TaxID=533267 RepID=UPI00035D4F0B|nr:ABC transporter substrate-binding protein [Actinopolymorpha alba]
MKIVKEVPVQADDPLKSPWRRRTVALASLLVLATGAAACQSGSPTEEGNKGTPKAQGMVSQLNMGDFGGGNAPQRNFNPFSPTRLVTDFTFEPLFVVNAYDCTVTPWLGTSYTWENPAKLVVKTRSGVTWSDGKPFSAKDVAFTYNLLKTAPALDTNGLWSKLTSVTAEGADQVTFAFKEASVPTFTQVSDVRMVPEHIWSAVTDVAKFTNNEAVGTGPYTVKSQNTQQLVLERNPKYWQADKIKVQRMMFKKATGGAEVDKLRLSRGEYDWNAMFVPDIEKTYVAKDPEHNHYWFPPGASISLFMNLTKAPFNDVEFRRAMTFAIDRDEIKNKAQFGYVETASQTGLVMPGQKAWLAPGIANDGKVPYDAAQAKKVLADAGYKTGPDGKLLGKDGKPLPDFSYKVPNGWVDWIQAAQVIQKNLADLGITVDVQTPSAEVHDKDRGIGNFDMFFGVHGGGCNIYQAFQHPLGSSQTAPIGKVAPTNFIRWKDAKTDALLEELAKAPDEAAQKTVVHQLEQIMVDQVPVVPLWYGAQWFEYRSEKAIGWPNAKDPYAGPGNQLIIMTKLRPNPDYRGK